MKQKQPLSAVFKQFGMFRTILVIAAGAVLILCSLPQSGQTGSVPETGTTVPETEAETDAADYERGLEARLQAILEQLNGVRSVSVMITIEEGEKRIPDKNTSVQNETQTETQSGGAALSRSTEKKEESTVFTEQKDGSRTPYIVQEIPPRIQGVLVAVEADGGLSAVLTGQISDAVQALFQIEAHKIRVLEKQSQAEG